MRNEDEKRFVRWSDGPMRSYFFRLFLSHNTFSLATVLTIQSPHFHFCFHTYIQTSSVCCVRPSTWHLHMAFFFTWAHITFICHPLLLSLSHLHLHFIFECGIIAPITPILPYNSLTLLYFQSGMCRCTSTSNTHTK